MWQDYEKTPTKVGWYAMHYCWDTYEGSFCNIHYWNGHEWDERLPFFQWNPVPFLTEDEAHVWLDKNDISW